MICFNLIDAGGILGTRDLRFVWCFGTPIIPRRPFLAVSRVAPRASRFASRVSPLLVHSLLHRLPSLSPTYAFTSYLLFRPNLLSSVIPFFYLPSSFLLPPLSFASTLSFLMQLHVRPMCATDLGGYWVCCDVYITGIYLSSVFRTQGQGTGGGLGLAPAWRRTRRT